jgi:hypothetical protein
MKGKLLATRQSTITKVAFKVEMFAFTLMFTLISYMIPVHLILPWILLQNLGYDYYWWGNVSMFFVRFVLLFLVSYIIGKRIVLRHGLTSAVVPLFLGSLAGSTVLFYYVSLPSVLQYSNDLIVIFAQCLSVISICLETFFVSFTAMTIGVIIKVK